MRSILEPGSERISIKPSKISKTAVKCLHFLLLQKQLQQRPLPHRIRLIPDRQIDPVVFLHDAAAVAEQFKALFSVIASHSARTDTSKSHIAGRKVDDRVVDTASAETAVFQDLLFVAAASCKQIKRQRSVMTRHVRNHFGKIMKRHHRQNRPENLFLHQRISRGNVIHNGRLNLKRMRITPSADLDIGAVQQPAKPHKMLFIDNPPIVRILKRMRAKLLPDTFLNLLQQPVFYRGMHKQIIRRYTRLSKI